MRKMIRNFVYDNLERDPEELVKERYERFRHSDKRKRILRRRDLFFE